MTDIALMPIFESYHICKMGTGGMGFNWPSGAWEDTPRQIVEAFLIIDAVFNQQEKEQQEKKWPPPTLPSF